VFVLLTCDILWHILVTNDAKVVHFWILHAFYVANVGHNVFWGHGHPLETPLNEYATVHRDKRTVNVNLMCFNLQSRQVLVTQAAYSRFVSISVSVICATSLTPLTTAHLCVSWASVYQLICRQELELELECL